MLSGDDVSAFATGILARATAPRNISVARDATRFNFRRFLVALNNVARTRSSFFESAMTDPTTPVDEIQECVIDTWRKLIGTGYNFTLSDRISQRNMELQDAALLAFGSAAQQELVCRDQLPQEIDGASLVCQCIGRTQDGQSNGERMEYFQLLVDIFFPGAKWASFSMVQALELELQDMVHVINAWGNLSVTQKLASLRAQRRVKQVAQPSKVGTVDVGHSEEELSGSMGTSGIKALRSADFIETRMAIKDLTDGKSPTFTKVPDLLGTSSSKVWRAVGLGKLKKAAGVSEIESCSKATDKWAKYWTICLATKPDGTMAKEAQEESQSAENTEALLYSCQDNVAEASTGLK